MPLPELVNLGNLPFAGLSAAVAWQILGPSAKYLGGKTKEMTEASVNNIERILKHAKDRLSKSNSDKGEVPPRVLKYAITEGAYTEDQVAAAYLGGVLASSKSENSRDDRGITINALISRLSIYQLRFHYIAYTAMHDLFQGMRPHFDYTDPSIQMRIGLPGLMIAMGFLEQELREDSFNMDSVLTHISHGLAREELCVETESHNTKDFILSPTVHGVELFLWANGKGTESVEYFFDPSFIPIEVPDEIVLIRGREVKIPIEGAVDGENVAEINGYDFNEQFVPPRCRWPITK